MRSSDTMNNSEKPDQAKLINWMLSWVQESGAVFGFHNESVWGGNPYRWGDYTCNHATWASPLIPALSKYLSYENDSRGKAVLDRLFAYQTSTFQPNGDYAHIGFQVGETARRGLIHNAIANVGLLKGLLDAPPAVRNRWEGPVYDAFMRNNVCHQRPEGFLPSNQEYARVWAKLLFELVYKDRHFHDEVPEDIDFLMKEYHVKGIPDSECSGTLRQTKYSLLEPALYYGLMIAPLVLAGKMYGRDDYLDEALRLSRHVVRSQWTEESGLVRFHRLWYKSGSDWRKMKEPMLISGMGTTLYGIYEVINSSRGDDELNQFLKDITLTYTKRQHDRGFFFPATGWSTEADIAPSSAWHSHDTHFFANYFTPEKGFWDRCFKKCPGTYVLLGDTCYWIENDLGWSIADYWWQSTYDLVGRKDKPKFGRRRRWVIEKEAPPEGFEHISLPIIIQEDEKIIIEDEGSDPLYVRYNTRNSSGS